MSPALNGSSAIRHFKGSDAIKIRDGITFDFYTGLPHIAPTSKSWPIVSSPDLIRHVYCFPYNMCNTESDLHWGWFWVWDQD